MEGAGDPELGLDAVYPPVHAHQRKRWKARNVEPVIEWFRRVVSRTDRADLTLGRRVAALPDSWVDQAFLRLTRSANHSVLWFGIATVLMTRAGTTRRAALRGLIAIAGASGSANGIFKPMVPRRRPPADELPPGRRLIRRPGSSSFPSGHAASAAAFATAVAMEDPLVAVAVVPVAAAVAYSRVHVGVHWGSDVVAGAAVGVCAALLTQRWWPVRPADEALARPADRAPELTGGDGLVIVVNPRSGDPRTDITDAVRDAFPAARLIVLNGRIDLDRELTARLGNGPVRALGVAGGDGTVASVASAASKRGLPLVLIPGGTLNHFARDVGVYDLTEAIDAAGAGEAVAVDLGEVRFTADGVPTDRQFINTASLGCYTDLVRLRERWEHRWGKWPAFTVALALTLHRAEPIRIRLDGHWRSVWILFIGNGPYHPDGMVPAWRPKLDSGLLDARWLRADLRWGRTRACIALALAALRHSRVYHQRDVAELDVELDRPTALALDGEVVEEADRFHFSVRTDRIPVYRRNEDNPRWSGRDRPHHRYP
jgi:undecaprenyl-diphosphatase